MAFIQCSAVHSRLVVYNNKKHLIFHSTIYVCRAFIVCGGGENLWENLVFLAFAALRRASEWAKREREKVEKVKDYGVTSCVARNVNKYNLSEGYRIFWHLWPLFMAFPLNAFSPLDSLLLLPLLLLLPQSASPPSTSSFHQGIISYKIIKLSF